MAAMSSEEMDSLIPSFDQIYQGYVDAIAEIQSLKSSNGFEISRRQTLEASGNELRTDNERLRRLYNESLTKLTYQVECRTKCQSLKRELRKANDRLLSLEGEHRKTTEMLKQENESLTLDLEKQARCSILQKEVDETTIKQLQQDLSSQKVQIGILTNSLENVTLDVNLKYQHEIEDLKDWVSIEQQEKKMLNEKLQNAENELQSLKAKQAEQQRESISSRQVDTLKQKIMKLRKENESLKRHLVNSEP